MQQWHFHHRLGCPTVLRHLNHQKLKSRGICLLLRAMHGLTCVQCCWRFGQEGCGNPPIPRATTTMYTCSTCWTQHRQWLSFPAHGHLLNKRGHRRVEHCIVEVQRGQQWERERGTAKRNASIQQQEPLNEVPTKTTFLQSMPPHHPHDYEVRVVEHLITRASTTIVGLLCGAAILFLFLVA